MWISLILLSVPTIYEIVADVNEWRKGERDKKTHDVIIRAVIMSLVSLVNCLFVDTSVTFWQSFILSVGVFIFFFDPMMGIYLKKNPFFLGTTSKTDQFWKFLPWYCQLLVRGTTLAIGFILYEYLEFIKFIFKLIFNYYFG